MGGREERDVAASVLQRLFRSRKARAHVRMLAKCAVEQVFDESSGCTFYFNRVTNESSWVKPKLLGDNDDFLTPRGRRRLQLQEEKRTRGALKSSEDMSEDGAARFIQSMYRSRKARHYLQDLLAKVYIKSYDEDGNCYFFNERSGESSWTKPALLSLYGGGHDDIPVIVAPRRLSPEEAKQADGEARREFGLRELQRFLVREELAHLEERLVEEGFDDMDALCAMHDSDVDELGFKKRYREPLLNAVAAYRATRGITDPSQSLVKSKSGVESEGSSSLGSSSSSSRARARKKEEGEEEKQGGDEGDSSDDDYGDDEGGEDGIRDHSGLLNSSSSAGQSGEFYDDDGGGDSDSDSDSDDESDFDSLADTTEVHGVEIKTVFPGDGVHFPKKGQFALVHYVGSLLDGTVFESSRKRGRPFDFLVGANHVIPGWDKAIRKMSRGERANLTIVPEMAYGAKGRPPVVPPNAVLRFEIELIDSYYAPVGELIEDQEHLDQYQSDDDQL